MTTLAAVAGGVPAQPPAGRTLVDTDRTLGRSIAGRPLITLFLCGDVMLGRGIDQILPYSNDPRLYEPFVRSAADYVALAEAANGPVPSPVEPAYIWGDALSEFDRVAPDVRVINLETAVTISEDHVDKGINYRMHPNNIGVLQMAGIDCAVLANNHVLDWGQAGLVETLETLAAAGIGVAGAGRDIKAATAPAVITAAGKGRVLVFAFGTESSGIPRSWAATSERAGVALLNDLSSRTVQTVARQLHELNRAGDIVVASLHWGGNWGYDVSVQQASFAHRLIDEAGVDIVHGHSSHHVKGIEVYRGRLIVYGCGDFLNDYEGIGGHAAYRGDLGLMYFVQMDATRHELVGVDMTPTRVKRLRVNHATDEESRWLEAVLNREGRQFGTRVTRGGDNRLTLQW